MKVSILVVEDNPVTSETLNCELNGCGFEVHLASTTEDALLKLQNGIKCEIIILDFHFSGDGEQGPTFYRRLGMDPNFKKITVVPFTSQLEATSTLSNQLSTDYATSLQIDQKDRARQPMVSKGFRDAIEKLPASLFVALAESFRARGIRPPEAFIAKMREALLQ